MKKKLLFVTILSLFIFGGCTGTSTRNIYKTTLISVETSTSVDDYNYEIKILEKDNKNYALYEDEIITLLLYANSKVIKIDFNNKTDSTMKIHWDNATFIDEYNLSNRVIHVGVKLTDSYNVQVPTIVSRRGRIEDNIVPAKNIKFINNEWRYSPLIKGNQEVVSLLLPIEVADEIIEYIFKFEIQIDEEKIKEEKIKEENKFSPNK